MVEARPSYFSNRKIHFAELSKDGLIFTQQFLDASSGIADFVGMLGKAFTPVKNDVEGNVKRIRARYLEHLQTSGTLQELVLAETVDKKAPGNATEALLWLKRGLQFLCHFLELLAEDHSEGKKSDNIVPILQSAYEMKLKRHHNWISRQLVSLCFHAAPWRKDLLRSLALHADDLDAEDRCIAHLQEYLVTMKQNVDVLVLFYVEQGLDIA